MAVSTLDEPQSNVSLEAQEAIAPPAPAGFDFDIYLAALAAALLAIGLMMVFSTTFDWSYLEFGSPIRIFLNQIRSFVIGLVALVIAWRMDYRVLRDRRIATALMIIAILALLALLVVGDEQFNANRSFINGSYQPGEAAKLALIIYFGAWLASKRERLHRFGYGLLPFSILVGAMGGLIILQPDISTAAILVLTAWTMFFLAGANIFQIILTGVGAASIGWVVTTQFDYARERLADHLAAMRDLTQADWHVQQAIIAFTAPGNRPGGVFSPNWLGLGLGQSRQKFGFLPFPHTDSIFAIIGEELGLMGCLVVIGLFGLLIWRIFKIALECPDFFGSMVASGIGAWIAYEALLNISVMTGIVPFTGVSLPFISYGGSSLVTMMAAVGLVMSISRRRLQKIDEVRQAPPIDMDYSQGVHGGSNPRVARIRRQRIQ